MHTYIDQNVWGISSYVAVSCVLVTTSYLKCNVMHVLIHVIAALKIAYETPNISYSFKELQLLMHVLACFLCISNLFVNVFPVIIYIIHAFCAFLVYRKHGISIVDKITTKHKSTHKSYGLCCTCFHDDVIKQKYFPR